MKHQINGLRAFLLSALSLVASGQKITCSEIEAMFPSDVATTLYNKYPIFRDFISADTLVSIDDYYKKWAGCAESAEIKKYMCDSNNGLQLLIALALNEIY